MLFDIPCSCGWSGAGDHLCHACLTAAGDPRFICMPGTGLAGQQDKLGARLTNACSPCWDAYMQKTADLKNQRK